jgi:epoxyqueuosine reductase
LSVKEEEFGQIFRGSPVRRAKWRGLIRNACVAAGNLADKYRADAPERLQLRKRLGELAASADLMVAEHAAWALSRFAASE